MSLAIDRKVLLYVAGCVALAALDIYGTSWFVHWRETFWEGIKAVNVARFWHDIGTFSGMAGLLVFASAYFSYLQNILGIHLRNKKIREFVTHGVEKYSEIPNYKQRIEADTTMYYALGISLSMGLVKAAVLLIVFLYLLVTMVHSTTIILVVAAYVVISTMISRIIAKPLIKLEYDLQTLNTNFRDSMCLTRLADVIALTKVWANKTKLVNLFQSCFMQISVIIPYVMLAPMYFTGHMSFGLLMAAGSLIGQLIADAGWIIGSVDQINKFHSARIRLNELETARV